MHLRSLFTLLTLSTCLALNGQETPKKEKVKPPNGWEKSGLVALLFNQSAFNAEWQGGGTTNVAGSVNLSYNVDYRKDKFSWETKFLFDYGITKIRDQEFARKTSDRLELNSILGSQILESNWNYSAFANFRTQIASGYEFFNRNVLDEDGNVVDVMMDRREITDGFSPAYLQLGPGMLWKKSPQLRLNIAPATGRFIFVAPRFTKVDEDNEEAIATFEPYFGVEANKTTRFELGASLSGYAKFKLMENITCENILNIYSDYLEKAGNIDIDYTLNIAMTVNKYITANFTTQAIYDDNAVSGFQVREVLGLGFKYEL